MGSNHDTTGPGSPPASPQKPSGSRRRRIGRWFTLAMLLLLATGAVLYTRWTDPERIRRLCEGYLQSLVQGQVSVQHASFRFFHGIQLDGVRIRVPELTTRNPASERPLFYCRNLLLKHDPLSLLSGELVVEEAIAVEPVCNLVRDDETGRYNVGRLLRPTKGGPLPTNIHLPVVRLQEASLIITRTAHEQARDVDRITLGIVATPIRSRPGTYSLAWRREGPEPAGGRSVFDPQTMTLTNQEGGLPWLSLETAMLLVEQQVPEAAQWFALLGVTGEIKAADYDVSFAGDHAGSSCIILSLRRASLSIPVDDLEHALPRDQRYLRFAQVKGRVEVMSGRAALDFTGLFHGASCQVTVELEGAIDPLTALEDLAMSATITCRDLQLVSLEDDDTSAAARRFVQRWRPLRSFYHDLDPHGVVDLKVTLAKEAGSAQPVRLVHGVITAHPADGSYRKFPYRVSNLHGNVEFTPEGIFLRDLHGDHDGAPILTRGWLAEARWYSAGELHFSGRNIALDQNLYTALNARYRKLWDHFDLGGAADIEVDMTRKPGTPENPPHWNVNIDGQLRDAHVQYVGFSYPVEELSGKVSIRGDRLTVRGLVGRHGPATVRADGHALLKQHGPKELDLRISATGLAFDQQLAAALPPDAARRLAEFQPQGTFDLTGDITLDPQTGRPTYDLRVGLQGVRVLHTNLPLPVEDLEGEVRVQPDGLTFSQLRGCRAGCRITVEGRLATSPTERGSDLSVTCTKLSADEALLEALPEPAASLCRQLHINGLVNLATSYTGSPLSPEGPDDWKIVIDPAGVTLNPETFPFALALSGGRVVIQPGRLRLEQLAAHHDDTRVAVNGGLRFDTQGVEGTFSFSARHVVPCEELRLAIPWRTRRTWNNISPTGSMDVQLDSLHYRRPRNAPAGEWTFGGLLALHGVGFAVGVPVDDIRGLLIGSGHVGDTPPRLTLQAQLSLDAATVYHRRLENLRGTLTLGGASGTLSLRELSGDLYGGRITGEVLVQDQPDGQYYSLSTTLHDVDLNAFLSADRQSDAPSLEVAGRFDARLYLSGSQDTGQRRGGGTVAIRDAELYRVPLILAVLNVINMTLPQESVFQELRAEFYIVDDRIDIRNLVLRGSALALIGTGTIVPRTQALDLKLVAVTPHRWAEVPVLTELLEGAARELMEIEVQGTLQHPLVRGTPVRGVGKALKRLFGKPKRPRSRPASAPPANANPQ